MSTPQADLRQNWTWRKGVLNSVYKKETVRGIALHAGGGELGRRRAPALPSLDEACVHQLFLLIMLFSSTRQAQTYWRLTECGWPLHRRGGCQNALCLALN